MRRAPIAALIAALTALLLAGCAADDLAAERRAGREQAEKDFAAGRAEPRLMCGTIAPGPCSSVDGERRALAWATGYNDRLRELRTR